MVSSPADNSTLPSINSRAKLAFGLSLLAFTAFIGTFYIAYSAPLGVGDDFVHGRAIYSTNMPTRIMLVLVLIVWAVAFLGSIGLEVSVLVNAWSGARPILPSSVAVTTVAFLLTILHLALLIWVATPGPRLWFHGLSGIDFIWSLIRN